jgi:hypothetical protein
MVSGSFQALVVVVAFSKGQKKLGLSQVGAAGASRHRLCIV